MNLGVVGLVMLCSIIWMKHMPLVPHFTEMAFNGHTNPAEHSEQAI